MNIKKNNILLILLIISLLFIVSVNKVFSQNKDAYVLYYFEGRAGENAGLYSAYSYDLLTWHKLASGIFNPKLGEWKVFRDPDVIKTKDGTFHLVWTCGESGFGYADSPDGINWRNSRFITVSNPGKGLDFMNVWAPEFYTEHDSVYVIWSSTLKKDFVPAKDNAEWWSAKWNHRFYYTSTADFRTFTPPRKFWDPDFNAIDATILKRNSLYYLFFKDERDSGKNIVLADSKNFYGPYHHLRNAGHRFTEGAIVVPVDTAIVLYYDNYDDNTGYRFKTSHDMSHWSPEILPQKDGFDDIFRHGSIVKVTGEELQRMQNEVLKIRQR